MMVVIDKGVCFVMFGDNEFLLFDQLQVEFFKVKFLQLFNNDGKQLDVWMMVLDNYLRKGMSCLDIFFDLCGIVF